MLYENVILISCCYKIVGLFGDDGLNIDWCKIREMMSIIKIFLKVFLFLVLG